MSHYIMLCYIISHYVESYYITLYYTIINYTILYYIILHYIISYYIILCYIISLTTERFFSVILSFRMRKVWLKNTEIREKLKLKVLQHTVLKTNPKTQLRNVKK